MNGRFAKILGARHNETMKASLPAPSPLGGRNALPHRRLQPAARHGRASRPRPAARPGKRPAQPSRPRPRPPRRQRGPRHRRLRRRQRPARRQRRNRTTRAFASSTPCGRRRTTSSRRSFKAIRPRAAHHRFRRPPVERGRPPPAVRLAGLPRLPRTGRQAAVSERAPRKLPSSRRRLSAEETRHWLKEFGDLADDPKFKGLVELESPPDEDE